MGVQGRDSKGSGSKFSPAISPSTMPSQDRQHHHHHLHLPSSSNKDSKPLGTPHEKTLSFILGALVLIILLSRPALIVLALLLVGYGRYYHHAEADSKRHGSKLWSLSKDNGHSDRHAPLLHFGDLGREQQRRGSLQDLAKGLNVPGLKL